jgi:hypothetical protein
MLLDSPGGFYQPFIGIISTRTHYPKLTLNDRAMAMLHASFSCNKNVFEEYNQI